MICSHVYWAEFGYWVTKKLTEQGLLTLFTTQIVVTQDDDSLVTQIRPEDFFTARIKAVYVHNGEHHSPRVL